MIEINNDFKHAFDSIVKKHKNVFITGRAGTGKSTFLMYLIKNSSLNYVLLAPTGVAAVNIGGQTIHSFFRFKPDITVSVIEHKKYKKSFIETVSKLDLIIIDEVSMVRCDLMDCIDAALRRVMKNGLPFGGKQMVFIGDLYQLPPVLKSSEKNVLKEVGYNSPFFFDAKVFTKGEFNFELIEFKKIYRQKDQQFIEILNRVRNNTVTDEDIKVLNRRVNESFIPNVNDIYIYLTTTNKLASEINERNLSRLRTQKRVFKAETSGSFDLSHAPTETKLELKVGAQVMLLNNDSGKRWINGTIGTIEGVEDDQILVFLETGEEVWVSRYTWDQYEYALNPKTGKVEAYSVGTFTQYPLKLAWAVTIHKSQGKTFDRIIIDIGRGTFTAGQLYVAISRATSLEGIVLKRPIAKKHIWVDYNVQKFLTSYKYNQASKSLSNEEKIKIIEDAIEQGKDIEFEYLKTTGDHSKRRVTPHSIEEVSYYGKDFVALLGYCHLRQADRVFRIDRILTLSVVND